VFAGPVSCFRAAGDTGSKVIPEDTVGAPDPSDESPSNQATSRLIHLLMGDLQAGRKVGISQRSSSLKLDEDAGSRRHVAIMWAERPESNLRRGLPLRRPARAAGDRASPSDRPGAGD
jgi:hypothetical protein